MRGRLAWLFARVVFTSLVFLFLLRIGVGAGLAIALNHVEERYDLAVEVEDFGLQLAPLQLTLRDIRLGGVTGLAHFSHVDLYPDISRTIYSARATLDSLVMTRFTLSLQRDRQGEFNFTRLLRDPRLFAFRIDSIRAREGKIDARDSLPAMVRGSWPMHSPLELHHFALGPLLYPEVDSLRFRLAGAQTTAAESFWRLEGRLHLADTDQRARVHLQARKIALAETSPYAIGLCGHSIDSGSLAMETRVSLQDTLLDGQAQVWLDSLALGPVYNDSLAGIIPWQLGLYLLRDSDKRIALSLPLKQNLQAEKIDLSDLYLPIVIEILEQAINAPLTTLARSLGLQNDAPEQIYFDRNSAALSIGAMRKLDLAAAILRDHPDTKLVISPAIVVTTEPEDTALASRRYQVIANYLQTKSPAIGQRLLSLPAEPMQVSENGQVSTRLEVKHDPGGL
jgi:hypothetical protein